MTNKFPKKRNRPWIPKKNKVSFYSSRTTDENILSFYSSKKWRSLRNYYFQMNPLCELCLENDYITEGKEVDHRIAIQDNGSMTSINNLQTLCRGCHASKSSREMHARYKKKLNTKEGEEQILK
jgi:5-methylcytosine-specific restriction enzyme A